MISIPATCIVVHMCDWVAYLKYQESIQSGLHTFCAVKTTAPVGSRRILHCLMRFRLPGRPSDLAAPHNLLSRLLLFLVPQMTPGFFIASGLRAVTHLPSCQGQKQNWQKSKRHLVHSALLRLSTLAGDWQSGQGLCFRASLMRGEDGRDGTGVMVD